MNDTTDRFANGNIVAFIGTWTDRFYPYLPWLRLNGIKYDLQETNLYDNGLEIVIYKGETKQQRRLINHYLNVELRKIHNKMHNMATRNENKNNITEVTKMDLVAYALKYPERVSKGVSELADYDMEKAAKTLCDYLHGLENCNKNAINNLVQLVSETTKLKTTKEFVDKVYTLFPKLNITVIENTSAARVIHKICGLIGIDFKDNLSVFAKWADAILMSNTH